MINWHILTSGHNQLCPPDLYCINGALFNHVMGHEMESMGKPDRDGHRDGQMCLDAFPWCFRRSLKASIPNEKEILVSYKSYRPRGYAIPQIICTVFAYINRVCVCSLHTPASTLTNFSLAVTFNYRPKNVTDSLPPHLSLSMNKLVSETLIVFFSHTLVMKMSLAYLPRLKECLDATLLLNKNMKATCKVLAHISWAEIKYPRHFPYVYEAYFFNFVETFVYIPVSEHFSFWQDNPSTWQVLHIHNVTMCAESREASSGIVLINTCKSRNMNNAQTKH